MAEALGVISSTITIWDLAYKLKKYGERIQAAPAAWKEYCKNLENLSHVESVLNDMMSSQTHAFNGIKSEELETLATKEIQMIKDQANHILGAYDVITKSPKKRIWEWLRVKRASIKFIVAEKDLQRLTESADKAKMSLQSAICLYGLETLNVGQTEMQDAFQLLHNSMRKQAKALERLDLDLKADKKRFCLVDEHGRRVKGREPDEMSTQARSSGSRRSSRRSEKGRTSARQGRRRKRGSTNVGGNDE